MPTQYEVMTYRVAIPETPLGQGVSVPIPLGWEPLSAMRQGETALILCRQETSVPSSGDAPTITTLNPNSLPAGSAPATVAVDGTNFDQTCSIYVDNQAQATFYISDTQLEYTARADLAGPGDHQVTVQGPAGTSNAATFTYT